MNFLKLKRCISSAQRGCRSSQAQFQLRAKTEMFKPHHNASTFLNWPWSQHQILRCYTRGETSWTPYSAWNHDLTIYGNHSIRKPLILDEFRCIFHDFRCRTEGDMQYLSSQNRLWTNFVGPIARVPEGPWVWEDQGWGASDWPFEHTNVGAWEKVAIFGSDRSSWYDCTRRSSIIEAGAWEKVAIYGSWEHFHRKLGHRIGCKTQGPHSHTQYGNIFPQCRCIHF